MRILFASRPAYGHLLPMLPLIRAAVRDGHDVVVSSGADLAPLIGRLGLAAHHSGVTLAESYARMPGHTTISELPAEEQPFFAARHLFGAGAVDRARDVLELMGTWRPDLVVHDTLELGSPAAAVRHGVPHVTHGYGPMVPGTPLFAAAIGAALRAVLRGGRAPPPGRDRGHAGAGRGPAVAGRRPAGRRPLGATAPGSAPTAR